MKKKQKNVNFGLAVKHVTAGSMVCVLALQQAMNLRFISVRVATLTKICFVCQPVVCGWGQVWGLGGDLI